jgi:hypothetical protein
VAGVDGAADLAFEIYSLGLGANACSRLLADDRAFDRACAAIEQRLPQSTAAGIGLRAGRDRPRATLP